MSFVVPCNKRPDFERYATSKSQAQLFLNGGLLTDTLRDLYDLVVNRDVIKQELYVLVMCIVCISFVLEIIGLTFAIILMLNKYPSRPVGLHGSKATNLSTVEDGTDVEMKTPEAVDVDSGENYTDLIGRPPVYLKSINDGLTVVSLLLVILYTIKSSFYPDSNRFLTTQGATTPSP